jgi:hypothetical protein
MGKDTVMVHERLAIVGVGKSFDYCWMGVAFVTAYGRVIAMLI